MGQHPPEPPPLPGGAVESVAEWLDHLAEWARKDHEAAQVRGHRISPEALTQLRLYEDAALLLREAYGLPTSRRE